jgi:hypothetical protein
VTTPSASVLLKLENHKLQKSRVVLVEHISESVFPLYQIPTDLDFLQTISKVKRFWSTIDTGWYHKPFKSSYEYDPQADITGFLRAASAARHSVVQTVFRSRLS